MSSESSDHPVENAFGGEAVCPPLNVTVVDRCAIAGDELRNFCFVAKNVALCHKTAAWRNFPVDVAGLEARTFVGEHKQNRARHKPVPSQILATRAGARTVQPIRRAALHRAGQCPFSRIREIARCVEHWQGGAMVLRWTEVLDKIGRRQHPFEVLRQPNRMTVKVYFSPSRRDVDAPACARARNWLEGTVQRPTVWCMRGGSIRVRDGIPV
jgi:hypothetical protein